MPDSEEFRVEVLRPENFKEVLHLCFTEFTPREALSMGLHIKPSDIENFMSDGVTQWLEGGVSVGIFHVPSGDLAAVGLGTILTRDRPETFNQETNGQGKAELLKGSLLFLEKQYDLFQDPTVDKVFEFALMTVSSKYNGKGLSYKLFNMSEKLARENKCQLCTSQSTGLGSQHIRTKCGFTLKKKIPYGDIEVNGKKVMDVAAMGNGTFVGIYVKDLRI